MNFKNKDFKDIKKKPKKFETKKNYTLKDFKDIKKKCFKG